MIKFRMLDKTENCSFIIHTRSLDKVLTNVKYETLVFSVKRDGSTDIDRVLEVSEYLTEDAAYAGHLNLWKKYTEL